MTVPTVLSFSDSRRQGFPVSAPEGPVATMDVGMMSSRFDILDTAGQLLCSGKKSFLGPWTAVDPTGAEIARLEFGWGRKRDVVLGDGRVLTAEGQWFGRDWTATDADGEVVLQSVPTSSAWGFHQNEWQVEQDGSLTLVQFLAVVELYRRMVQAQQAGSTAAAVN